MISAETITLHRGGRPVVRELSLELAPGEVLAVLGPNGAGKSTLLDALTGGLRPAAGEVRLAGKALRSWRARDLARHRAVLLQHSPLAFPLPVHEVVAMGRAPHGPTDRDAIVASCLAEVGISHLASRTYIALSGGEQQRVHLARALAQLIGAPSPRFLLLDEPVNHLDPAHQHQLLAVARRLALFEEVGVLAVLHDLNLAAAYADRIAVLHQGRLVALGTPREVLTESLLAHTFGLEAEILTTHDIPHVLVRPHGLCQPPTHGA